MAFLPSTNASQPMVSSYGCEDYGFFGATKKAPKKIVKAGMLGPKPKMTGVSFGKKRKRPAVSDSQRRQLISKYNYLRDEDRQLEAAFAAKDAAGAGKVFSRLARIRDAGYRKAASALKGKRFTQIHGRTTLAIATAGSSELARLIPGVKKSIATRRAKAAEKFKAQAHAADDIFRYWRAHFAAAYKGKQIVMTPILAKKIEALEVEGESHKVPLELGESTHEAEAKMEEAAGPEAAQAQDAGPAPGDTAEAPTSAEGDAAAVAASSSTAKEETAADTAAVEAAPAEGMSTTKKLAIGGALAGAAWAAMHFLKR